MLVTSNLKGEKFTVPVPKGTRFMISTPGLHYNRKLNIGPLYLDKHIPFQARYWKDPYEFNPSRFLGDWDRDAFLPFSAGMLKDIRLSGLLLMHGTGIRACLGRRYITVFSRPNYLTTVQVL